MATPLMATLLSRGHLVPSGAQPRKTLCLVPLAAPPPLGIWAVPLPSSASAACPNTPQGGEKPYKTT